MPNWRRVITSGSDASLNTLTVSNGITGSLLGTSSYATSASRADSIPLPGAGNGEILFNTGGVLSAANRIYISSNVLYATNGGTVSITGSLFGTASLAFTASYVETAQTASYVSPTFISSSVAASGFGGGSVTINNNTDNYVVTATGTANTLNGESALTFNGTTLGVGVTSPYASVKAHIKGISGVENGSTAGTLADQILLGYSGGGLTQYNHKIQTSHDAQPVLNKMDFLISNGASSFLDVLTLRSFGFSRFDSGQGLGVSGSLQVTGSLNVTQGITGSLQGTATTASFVTGSIFTNGNRALSASYAVSASFAPTAGNISAAVSLFNYYNFT